MFRMADKEQKEVEELQVQSKPNFFSCDSVTFDFSLTHWKGCGLNSKTYFSVGVKP